MIMHIYVYINNIIYIYTRVNHETTTCGSYIYIYFFPNFSKGLKRQKTGQKIHRSGQMVHNISIFHLDFPEISWVLGSHFGGFPFPLQNHHHLGEEKSVVSWGKRNSPPPDLEVHLPLFSQAFKGRYQLPWGAGRFSGPSTTRQRKLIVEKGGGIWNSPLKSLTPPILKKTSFFWNVLGVKDEYLILSYKGVDEWIWIEMFHHKFWKPQSFSETETKHFKSFDFIDKSASSSSPKWQNLKLPSSRW